MVPARWKLVLYGLIILVGSLVALPSLLSTEQLASWPDWLPRKQVALGLDLRGGAQLVLELDEHALQKEQEQAGLSGVAAAERLKSALQQSIEIVRRRVDAIGVAEPTIQALGTNRILVQLPGVQDPASIRTLLGSTAKLTFHRVQSIEPRAEGDPRVGSIRVPAADEPIDYILEQQPMLQGERLTQASASIDSRSGGPVVAFRFDAEGAKRFAEITRQNVGRQFAMVLDGKVISAPLIQEPITGGAGQIQGNFTVAETSSLAALLRAGALPVPLQIADERMVGPDLGSDAIRMGAITGAGGLLLVLAFMTVLYRGWGVIANFALLVNVTLTLAAMTLLGAPLTLPGIAGIVLGIGLAVDANVLINERIREETRNGKSAAAALTNGFDRAYATIIDSNVTALIATLLLFWLGSGPVQGFAVTMAIGIGISMFTAVAVVRALMSLWVRWRRPRQFVIGSLLPDRWIHAKPRFQFMRARFIGIGVSLVLSAASVALFIKPGLNYGVDFTGGTIIEASAPSTMHIGELRTALEHADLGEVTLQQAGEDGSTVLVRIQQQPDSSSAAQTQIAEQAKAAIVQVEPDASFDRVDIIGPKVSGELADAGILAVLFASVAMFVYIWIRFDWHFAVGAIATLMLDTTKALGFFALTGLEFNLTAIAALLTLIGYSVNDKVVVYDRMREHLRLQPDAPLRGLIDRSINETLARSVFTSATAFLAMVPMAIWGGATVASFAVPMVFGIVIAASSSVFIAAPIMLLLGERINRSAPKLQEAGAIPEG
ncbi:protein translocase subunit SecD [Steroidobacter sp. S1-65]|uniref:Multifunctional fusion protein n=1 Tax=Steroidobacter gossypii TaxID=2805490 RepID=A0ABS1WQZ6_9GAMM|nr:protein translocase subunit SecD [Steroidobacter gossypii]MBM0103392.1 protein translocase subunit SecD [Steroidobacter gossypii]